MPDPIYTSRVRVDARSCPSEHSTANKVARLLWQLVWLLLFRPSPWMFHGWRRFLLRIFRARIGRSVKIMPSVQVWAPWNLTLGDYASVADGVDLYSVDRIEIGAHATVSQRAFLCTAGHEIDHPNMPLKTGPVHVSEGAWVCAEAYVHPGVTLGVDSVAAVRAVVLHDTGPREVVGGNPAKVLRLRVFPDAC